MAHIVGNLTVKADKVVQPTYTLDHIERHADNIRNNAWDINSGLRGLLTHLRGEGLTCGGVSECSVVTGKLVEISTSQQHTRDAQEETFRLITELQSLLNVNA